MECRTLCTTAIMYPFVVRVPYIECIYYRELMLTFIIIYLFEVTWVEGKYNRYLIKPTKCRQWAWE